MTVYMSCHALALCTGKGMLCIMCRHGVWLPYFHQSSSMFEGMSDQAGTQMPCVKAQEACEEN